MGALQMGKFDAPECAGKQAYFVFAYDDSVSTLGPDVRVTTDSRREGDVLVSRGLRMWVRSAIPVRSRGSRTQFRIRNFQLTLLLGRDERGKTQ